MPVMPRTAPPHPLDASLASRAALEASRAARAARIWRRLGLAVLIGSVPPLSALAGSLSVPVVRDNVTGAISRTTAPITDRTNKVIAPAADLTPRIGDTSAAINDTAMFRADSALQNQIASDSSGWIAK